jgi:hypothetical protein
MRKGGIRGACALDVCADIARGGCSGVRFVAGIVVTDFPASAVLIFEEEKALRLPDELLVFGWWRLIIWGCTRYLASA